MEYMPRGKGGLGRVPAQSRKEEPAVGVQGHLEGTLVPPGQLCLDSLLLPSQMYRVPVFLKPGFSCQGCWLQGPWE